VPEPDEARPGETVAIRLETGEGRRPTVDLVAPEGWEGTRTATGFALTVPADAAPTDPYPARHEPSGVTAALFGLARYDFDGTDVEVPVPLETRLNVLPRHVVRLEPASAVFNLAGPAEALSVRVGAEGAATGDPAPDIAGMAGWSVAAGGRPGAFRLMPKSASKPGLAELPVSVGGAPAATLMRARYPHTGKVFRAAPAVLRVLTLSCELPEGLRIAYVGGGADRADASLRDIGANVTVLDEGALASAEFAAFDTIVIGIFALGVRPDLVARLAELHDWVRAGGNLVTLYHRPWDNWAPETTPLARLEIGQPSLRWRVTDAGARVKVLAPKHPLLAAPNKIGAKDWAGWKKERGLYFASAWDEAYTPLLEMADPDEAPHRGALLTGEFGKGRHTHVALILHHQMEQLVPGGFRLMANLVSGGKG
jgi:hypothetical protein